ncbi:MAG: nucleoside kinase [Bacteroidetes bacterium]|nr:nucleoside kinase [Bacteroidota bacterium]
MMNQVIVQYNEFSLHQSQSYPFGTKISTALKTSKCMDYDDRSARTYENDPIVAVLVNNELKSLSDPLEYNCAISPVRLFSEYGKRMYRHSLSFLFTMAGRIVCPEREMVIGHSLGDGYYFTFADGESVSEELVTALKNAMQELAARELPISKIIVAYSEAIDWLTNAGRHNSILLLNYQNKAAVQLYECGNYRDISYEPLLPSTALITKFQLRKYGSDGILLRYPRSTNPLQMGNFSDNPVLFSIYQEYKKWGAILSADNLGKVNQLCEKRQIAPFIQVAESLQNKKISNIADSIAKKRAANPLKFILIAGPSSSGKTTFAKRLSIQLKVLGFKPLAISLDDYYRDRKDVPLDTDGKPDLEALEALNIRRLNSDLLELSSKGNVIIPQFDFNTAKRKPEGKELLLPDNGIIILEGIHGLNPGLTPGLPDESKFKIYISALTQLNLDNHNRISTTDNRIIRRIVRDHNFRGMSALETLNMWPSVHRGEKSNIFPYQNNADAAFNSALDYELAVLKPYAEPLLKMVKPSDPVYWNAVRLLTFLDNFYPVPANLVPVDSLLREFIGGSIFYS